MGLSRKMKSKFQHRKKPFEHGPSRSEADEAAGTEDKDVYVSMDRDADSRRPGSLSIPARTSSVDLCEVCFNHPCVCRMNQHEMGSDSPTDGGVHVCDACLSCNDVCGVSGCPSCGNKTLHRRGREGEKEMTMCEVLRHRSRASCWLVAHGFVYDVTSVIDSHPGGVVSILNGTGRDCTRDHDFHGVEGKKAWAACRIGRLVQCPGRKERGEIDRVAEEGLRCVVC